VENGGKISGKACAKMDRKTGGKIAGGKWCKKMGEGKLKNIEGKIMIHYYEEVIVQKYCCE
jgi:hypothetical protein